MTTYHNMVRDLYRDLSQTLLNFHLVPYEATEPYRTYCFKGRILQHLQQQLWKQQGSSPPPAKTLMWADTSIRFGNNPVVWARRMLNDHVAVATHTGALGRGENTAPAMWRHLEQNVTNFAKWRELASGYWMVNLVAASDTVWPDIVQPWIACSLGTACRTCMAPPGSFKKIPNDRQIQGPPSTTFLAHRQDQSAWSILVYDFVRKKKGNIAINDVRYLNVSVVRREVGATSTADLLKTEA